MINGDFCSRCDQVTSMGGICNCTFIQRGNSFQYPAGKPGAGAVRMDGKDMNWQRGMCGSVAALEGLDLGMIFFKQSQRLLQPTGMYESIHS